MNIEMKPCLKLTFLLLFIVNFKLHEQTPQTIEIPALYSYKVHRACAPGVPPGYYVIEPGDVKIGTDCTPYKSFVEFKKVAIFHHMQL